MKMIREGKQGSKAKRWLRRTRRNVEGRIEFRAPTAASFPGLPEEFMRIVAVSTIAGANETRNTASRLTEPVPDRSCRARNMAAALGRGHQQLTPALLGVG